MKLLHTHIYQTVTFQGHIFQTDSGRSWQSKISRKTTRAGDGHDCVCRECKANMDAARTGGRRNRHVRLSFRFRLNSYRFTRKFSSFNSLEMWKASQQNMRGKQLCVLVGRHRIVYCLSTLCADGSIFEEFVLGQLSSRRSFDFVFLSLWFETKWKNRHMLCRFKQKIKEFTRLWL